MRTILHLVALVGGAAIAYRGWMDGLPAWPFTAYEWGSVVGFGFGVLLVLVGLRYLGRRLTSDDGPLVGGTAVLVVALAAGATAGAVVWQGRDGSRECAAMLEHVRALVVARDPRMTGARFDEARASILRRCEGLTKAQRRCSFAATTIEELQRCDG